MRGRKIETSERKRERERACVCVCIIINIRIQLNIVLCPLCSPNSNSAAALQHYNLCIMWPVDVVWIVCAWKILNLYARHQVVIRRHWLLLLLVEVSVALIRSTIQFILCRSFSISSLNISAYVCITYVRYIHILRLSTFSNRCCCYAQFAMPTDAMHSH